MGAPPQLLRVYRSGHLESVHRGALVVWEGDRPRWVRGEPSWRVFYRSTSKPLQALVGVTSGAADAFGLTPAELALAAGSHSTRPEHVVAARSILHKARVPEAALQCGGHFAYDPVVGRRQREACERPLPIWSNCSGKHAIMLAAARCLGAPLDTYLDAEHPVQVEIRRHVAHVAGLAPDEVVVGVDGCGAPAFAVPLDAMARSLACFGAPDGLPDDLATAARRVGEAMLRHPDMVAGPGRFDTELMKAAPGKLLAKAGAEGVHGVAVPGRRLGLAVKVEDGRDRGYRLVVVEALHRLGVLTDDAAGAVSRLLCDPVVRSRSGAPVGRLEVVLDGLAEAEGADRGPLEGGRAATL